MALAENKLENICESLKFNFLYNNDINSIHILLNLYDIEKRMVNISPTYVSAGDIKKRVKRVLSYRKDREILASNIIDLIHEDIDRFELVFNIEGYTNGYYNIKAVNTLEEKIIMNYPLEDLYENKYNFSYDIDDLDILNVRYSVFKEIEIRELREENMKDFTDMYCDEFIKSKVYRLNENLDRQLRLDFKDGEIILNEERTFLSIKELNNIYQIITSTIYDNIQEIYKDASWYGINDRLLNRY